MQLITVDLRSRVPIYEQVIENIRTAILSGELRPDEQLPSVRAMASELGINPNTIQKALGELERQGVIYTLKGRGSFVSGDTEALGEDALRAVESDIAVILRRARDSGMDKERILERINSLCAEIWKKEANGGK